MPELSSDGALLEHHYADLLQYVVRELKDPHDAQDLVHDVFERVLAVQRSGSRIDNPRGLLYRAARNLLVDRYRFGLLRQHRGEEALAELPAPPAGEPEAVCAARQRARRLVAVIEALPPRCREAFVLHRIDGLSHADVAACMGVTVNMVERHVMLAVATCRKALGDERPSRPPDLRACAVRADSGT